MAWWLDEEWPQEHQDDVFGDIDWQEWSPSSWDDWNEPTFWNDWSDDWSWHEVDWQDGWIDDEEINPEQNSEAVIDTGATKNAVGIDALNDLVVSGGFSYLVTNDSLPTFRFGNGQTDKAVSKVSLQGTSLGPMSFYVLDGTGYNNGMFVFRPHGELAQVEEEAKAVQLEALSSGHLTIDLAANPVHVSEGFPCFGKHKEGKMRQNQHATWSQCVQCGLRLAYVSKKAAGGHTRQMGPDPHLIRLAMASIEKITPPDQVTADMVNGKLMEIKGTMLQMGIKTSLAINMTLKEYEERLERYGRADGKPLVTVKKEKERSAAPSTPATTVPGSPEGLKTSPSSAEEKTGLKADIKKMMGYKPSRSPSPGKRSSPSAPSKPELPIHVEEENPVIDVTSEDEHMDMANGHSAPKGD
ncbi:unnamed protein product [Durusdinium trenchii]|uniref:Uncharacterized protein n=1 Tax=Durusdinium trenchii TaxID=1381693 RepID=A0ABP0NV90_9DINO